MSVLYDLSAEITSTQEAPLFNHGGSGAEQIRGLRGSSAGGGGSAAFQSVFLTLGWHCCSLNTLHNQLRMFSSVSTHGG